MENPCRVVLHVLPDGQQHLDLFIKSHDAINLITYEISGSSVNNFYNTFNIEYSEELNNGFINKKMIKSEIAIVASEIPFNESGKKSSLIAIRKADHRTKYWYYSGNISLNRGEIFEIAVGKFRADSFSAKIFLKNVS